MIGQKNLHSRIIQLIESDSFPRFSIIVGARGSEKTELAHQIACDLHAIIYDCNIKVDDIRNMITDAYKVHETMCYVISDADSMSLAAKNALLKVTEEPPNNAYFIMTLENEYLALETIRSRAQIFYTDLYTPTELTEYAKKLMDGIVGQKAIQFMVEICKTPGDVEILSKMNIGEFMNYVDLVIDNIAEVSISNAFKIPNKVALKEDSTGYDLELFWQAFCKLCLDRFESSHDVKYAKAVILTGEFVRKLQIKGINRQSLIDMWILAIRKAWL